MIYKTMFYTLLAVFVVAGGWAATNSAEDPLLCDDQARGLEWRTNQVNVLRLIVSAHSTAATKAEVLAMAKAHNIETKEDSDGVWLGDVLVHFENNVISELETY